MSQSLLQISEVLYGGGGEVCSDRRVPLTAGDDLSSHHVRSTEASRLHAPSLGTLSEDQAHTPVRVAGICGNRCQTHHFIDHTVMEIRLAGDLGIGQ